MSSLVTRNIERATSSTLSSNIVDEKVEENESRGSMLLSERSGIAFPKRSRPANDLQNRSTVQSDQPAFLDW